MPRKKGGGRKGAKRSGKKKNNVSKAARLSAARTASDASFSDEEEDEYEATNNVADAVTSSSSHAATTTTATTATTTMLSLPAAASSSAAPVLRRRASVAMVAAASVRLPSRNLRVGVWNVQDFGAGPSGMWAVSSREATWTAGHMAAYQRWKARVSAEGSSTSTSTSRSSSGADAQAVNQERTVDRKIKRLFRHKKMPFQPSGMTCEDLRYGFWKERVESIEDHCAGLNADITVILEAQTRNVKRAKVANSVLSAQDILDYDKWVAEQVKVHGKPSSDAWQYLVVPSRGATDLIGNAATKMKAGWAHEARLQTLYPGTYDSIGVESGDLRCEAVAHKKAAYATIWDTHRQVLHGLATTSKSRKRKASAEQNQGWIDWIDELLADELDRLDELEAQAAAEEEVEEEVPSQSADDGADASDGEDGKEVKESKASASSSTRAARRESSAATALPDLASLQWVKRIYRYRTGAQNSSLAVQDLQGSEAHGPLLLRILTARAAPNATWVRGKADATGETIFIRTRLNCADPWTVSARKIQPLQDGFRPAWHFVATLRAESIKVIAVHAPSPKNIPNAKIWFDQLHAFVAECARTQRVVLMGDFNTNKDQAKTGFIKEFYSKFDPPFARHASILTSAKMKEDARSPWSQPYDKILILKGANHFNSGLFQRATAWDSTPLALRRYSDHAYVYRDLQWLPVVTLASLSSLSSSSGSDDDEEPVDEGQDKDEKEEKYSSGGDDDDEEEEKEEDDDDEAPASKRARKGSVKKSFQPTG